MQCPRENVKNARNEVQKIYDEIDHFAHTKNKWERTVDNIDLTDVANKALRKLGLSDEQADAIIKAKPQIQKHIEDIAYNFRIFNDRVSANAQKHYDTFTKEIKPKESRLLFRAIAGWMDEKQMNKFFGVYPHLKNTYEQYRKLIDEKANELVSLGVLDEKNKIKDYVRYYYEKNLDEVGMFKRAFNKLLNSKVFARNQNLTNFERVFRLHIKDDFGFAVSQTLKDQTIQIEKAKIFKHLADNYASKAKADGLVQVPNISMGGGTKRYGALSGKWVQQELLDTLNGADMLVQTLSTFEKSMMPIVNHIKVNLTVKNPATHVYNYVSNLIKAYFKGGAGTKSLVAGDLIDVLAMQGKVLGLGGKGGRAEYTAWRNLADNYGISDNIERVNPLDASKQKPKDKSKQGLVSKIAKAAVINPVTKNLYMSEGSAAGKAMREAYAFEDKLFKITHFKKLMDSVGFDIKKAGDSEYIKGFEAQLRQAAKKANAEYVDYSDTWSYGGGFLGDKLPKGIKWADKMGILPFWQYMWKSTPMMARSIVKHPVKFAAFQLALISAGGSIFNNDNAENNALIADWAQSNYINNLFGAKSWGRVGDSEWYINYARAMPALRFAEFFSVQGLGGFYANLFQLWSGKNSFGRDITNKNELMPHYSDDSMATSIAKGAYNIGKKSLDIGMEVGKSYLPNGRYIDAGIRRAGAMIEKELKGAKYDEKDRIFTPPARRDEKELSATELAVRPLGLRQHEHKKNLQERINASAKRYELYKKRGDKKAMAKELKEAKWLQNVAKKNKVEIKTPKAYK